MACPCLGAAGLNLSGWTTLNAGGVEFSVFTPDSAYGEFYGIGCAKHDEGLAPYCQSGSGYDEGRWCSKPWCWVDTNACSPVSSYQPTPSAYLAGSGLHYSYQACNTTDSNFADFYTTGFIGLCSVFSAVSAADEETLCGHTNTKAQVSSMVAAINSLNGGRGFVLPHAGEAIAPHMRMTYSHESYAFGTWEAEGRQKSSALFANAECDVIIGMANGCPDEELQEQAKLARDAGKIYITGRGPRSVLLGAGNAGDGEPWVFSTHIRSDHYAESALLTLVNAPHLARSIAIIYESLAYAGNEFVAGLGRGSVEVARGLGYEVLVEATIERPAGHDATAGAALSYDLQRLNASLVQAVTAKADILLIVAQPPEWEYATSRLRQLREPGSLGAGSAGHSFKAVWWQGTSYAGSQSGGQGNCLDLGPSICGHAIGAEQMSRAEALDAYGDAILNGRTYRWLKMSSYLTEPIESHTDKPDGAMIPSLIAQAMQLTFKQRELKNKTRPLANPDNYGALLASFRSGLELGRTFYGAVRFDEYGQNKGKEPTTVQMDADGDQDTRSMGACLLREPQSCGLGKCIQPYASSGPNASALSAMAAADGADDSAKRARVIIPTALFETGLEYPTPASLSCADGRVLTFGGACLLCSAEQCSGCTYAFRQDGGCRQNKGPHLSFYWPSGAPPNEACALPENMDVATCPTNPQNSYRVILFVIICGLLPVLLLLVALIAGATHCCMGVSAATVAPRESPYRQDVVARRAMWRARAQHAAVAYGITWLGATAHAVATPIALADANSGDATDARCQAQLAISVLASAFVVVGVTVRIGQAMARVEDPQSRLRLRYALASGIILFGLVAGLSFTLSSTDGPAAVPSNHSEFVELVIGEDVEQDKLELSLNRCRSLHEFSWASLCGAVLPLATMYVFGFCVHVARIRRKLTSTQRADLGLYTTLVSLVLNLLQWLMLLLVGSLPLEDEHVVYGFRCGVSAVAGWLVLWTEVVLPELRWWWQYNLDLGYLLVDGEGQPLQIEDPLRQPNDVKGQDRKAYSHLFLSHCWSKGQDQVQSLNPMLKLMVPSLSIWLDTERLETDVDLEGAIEKSDAFLLFLTERYLASISCRKELRKAWESKMPIIIIREATPDHGRIEDDEILMEIEEAQDKADKARAAGKEWTENGKAIDAVMLDAMRHIHHRAVTGEGVLWWYRDASFKREVLKQVVQMLLTIRHREKKLSGPQSKRWSQRAVDSRTILEDNTTQSSRREEDYKAPPEAAEPSHSKTTDASKGDTEKDCKGKDDSRLFTGLWGSSGAAVSWRLPKEATGLRFSDEAASAKGRKRQGSAQQARVSLSTAYPPELRAALKMAFEANDAIVEEPRPNNFGATPILCLFEDFYDSDELMKLAERAFQSKTPSSNAHYSGRLAQRSPSYPVVVAQHSSMRSHHSHTIPNYIPTAQGNADLPDEQTVTVDAVLLYSTARTTSHADREQQQDARPLGKRTGMSWVSFSEYMETAEDYVHADRLAKNAGLFRALWRMWPQDKMLQKVAAKLELNRLGERR